MFKESNNDMITLTATVTLYSLFEIDFQHVHTINIKICKIKICLLSMIGEEPKERKLKD